MDAVTEHRYRRHRADGWSASDAMMAAKVERECDNRDWWPHFTWDDMIDSDFPECRYSLDLTDTDDNLIDSLGGMWVEGAMEYDDPYCLDLDAYAWECVADMIARYDADALVAANKYAAQLTAQYARMI